MNKKKYFKILIIFFIFFLLYLVEICFNIKYANGLHNVVVKIKCTKDIFKKIKVFKISPTGNVDEFYKDDNIRLFYYLQKGYFKKIKIEISESSIKAVRYIKIKINKKDFIYKLDELLNVWEYDSKNNILYSPDSIKNSQSLFPNFKKILNWPGDFAFFILPFFKYLFFSFVFIFLFYFINSYINKELLSNGSIIQDDKIINKIDKWLLINKKNIIIYNSFYIFIILFIIIFSLFQRMYYNFSPYAGGDVWGYIGPAINYFDNGEFIHIFGRSFPYPLFITIVLSIFKDFSYIAVIQHLIGILTGVVFFIAWRNLIKLYSSNSKLRIINDCVGIIIVSLYLFFDSTIYFEHQLARESIYPFLLIMHILFLIKYIINIKKKSKYLYLWGGLFFINNYFLFVYQPRWGFTLLFCLFICISSIFFIKDKIINKIFFLIIIPFIISFLFIYLPEKILIKNETTDEIFLPQHLFFGHAKIIDKELKKDIEDDNFNKYNKELLRNIQKAFHEEFNTSETKHKYLGYDFNRLVYSGWIVEYIRVRMSKEEYKKFCNYYFRKAVLNHPFKYLKKVLLELSQFYNFNGEMYPYRSYIVDRMLYKETYLNLKESENIDYIPYITYMDAVKMKMSSFYDLKEIKVWLSNLMFYIFSKTYLIIFIIFLIVFIKSVIFFFRKRNLTNDLIFQLIILSIFLFNFFISLTISLIYTYDVRRYFQDQMIIALFSQMICFEYLIIILYNIIKKIIENKR